VSGLYGDVAVFSRLLDDAEVPVARQEIVTELHAAKGDPADEVAVLRQQPTTRSRISPTRA